MIVLVILLISWFGGSDQTWVPLQPDNNYRAAKYSVNIDLTYMQDLAPGLRSNMISYSYYVQYGENSLIQIIVSGEGPTYLPDYVFKWDYTTGEITREYIFHKGLKYYIERDSIELAIEEKNGTIKNLCDKVRKNSKCDSVAFTSSSTNSEYVVYVSDNIANIRASDLFYPDIKYLPYKIINKHKRNSPRILEEVIYGKQAVDSLLALHDHRGYKRITDKEWRSTAHKLPQENIELIKTMQKRMVERNNRD